MATWYAIVLWQATGSIDCLKTGLARIGNLEGVDGQDAKQPDNRLPIDAHAGKLGGEHLNHVLQGLFDLLVKVFIRSWLKLIKLEPGLVVVSVF